MPKKSFGPAPPDEENHGVYDPDDYDANGDYRGNDTNPYEDEDLADREENPDDYDNSVSPTGDDSELRKLSSGKELGHVPVSDEDRAKANALDRRMYNPNGDKKGAGNMVAGAALSAAAAEAGPAGKIAKKAFELFGKTKKGKARGGIAGVVLSIAMIGAFAGVNNYANHFLNHMVEVFDKEVAKTAKHEEQKVARTVMQRMIDRALKRAQASDKEKQQMDDEAEKAKAEGRSVAEATESGMLADSKTLQQFIKDADLELKFNANGELDGIVDRTGADVGEQIGKESPSTRALIEQEWDVSKLYNQRTNFTFHSGSSFNVFPEDGSEDKNAKKTISQAIENGASAEAIKMAEAEQEKNIPEGADQNTTNAINDTEQKAELIKEVTDATDKEFKQSYDAEAATEAGVKAGLKSINKVGNSLSLAAIATTACTVKEGFQVAADRRVPKLVVLLMRNYSTLKSLASELNAGKLTSRVVNQTSLLYFGNKGLFPNKDGTPKEASFPVTRSAAWHRASHVTVDSNPKSPYYTPDIKPGVTPTRSGPTKLVDSIQKIFNATGLEFACDALTSKGGLIAQTGLTAVQVAANIGSFGAVQAGILAVGTAFNLALEFEILPAIPGLFSNTGATGTNAAVDNGNNDEVGGNIAWKDYARSTLGAVPVSDATAKQANDVADADQLREKQSQSLAYRTFAIDNTDSLLSRLIMRIPLDTQASIASMGSYFANFPFTIMHTLANVFAPPSLQAASNTGCKSDPHCLTGYVLTDSIIDRYSKGTAYVDNENFLYGQVSYGGKSVKRIDALGNPNTYTPSPAGDSNNDDLLHCFVDSPEQLAPMSDGSNDDVRANCGSMGSYDSTAYPPEAPNNGTVAGIYCKALGKDKYDRGCMDAMNMQIDDDFYRYCVYQAFSTVARTYIYASKITES